MGNGVFQFNCEEKASSFLNTHEGLHCTKCNSPIIDLKDLSDSEIQKVVFDNPNGFCGQFYEDQLLVSKTKNLVLSSLVAMSTIGHFSVAQTQPEVPKTNMESVESQICPKTESPTYTEVESEELGEINYNLKKAKHRSSKFKLVKRFPFIVRRRYFRGKF